MIRSSKNLHVIPAKAGIQKIRKINWIPACAGMTLILSTSFSQSQYHLPLDPPLMVSGTFGERRTTHFHSGVDFSTQKKTGFPVYAIETGFVSRIKVAPDGYGNGLYVQLLDGHTAVYAHLEGFSKKIEAKVLEKQLAEKNSFVDFSLNPDILPVERGEVIAFSGDSGGVPPHLHFELRNKQEHALNPLTHAFILPDTQPPKILGVALVHLKSNSAPIPLQKGFFRAPAWNEATKKYVLPNQETPFELTGIEASLNDESFGNACAPLEVSLFVDRKLYFQRAHTQFSFKEHPYPFLVYNRKWWLEKKENYERLYVYPGSHLSFQKSFSKTQGAIFLNKGETKQIALVTKDATGNTSTLEFSLSRSHETHKEKPGSRHEWHTIHPNFSKTLRSSDFSAQLTFPKNSVFVPTRARLRISSSKPFVSFPLKSAVYQIQPQDFLLKNKVLFSVCLPKENVKGIALFQWQEGKWRYVKNQKRQNHTLQAWLGSFGTFALLQDLHPPRISNIRREIGSDGEPRLFFNVEDTLSSVDYRQIQIHSGKDFLIYQVNLNRNEVSLKLSQIPLPQPVPLELKVADFSGNTQSQKIHSTVARNLLQE